MLSSIENSSGKEAKKRQSVLQLVRLLRCIRMLSNRHYKSRELSEELGVCRRTIYRDISILREADLLVVFEDSKGYIIVGNSDKM